MCVGTVRPGIGVVEDSPGVDESAGHHSHASERLCRRSSAHSQRREELPPGPVVVSRDCAVDDLSGDLCVVMLPFSECA